VPSVYGAVEMHVVVILMDGQQLVYGVSLYTFSEVCFFALHLAENAFNLCVADWYDERSGS